MPITEVRHESVKSVTKGEAMIITHMCLRHGAHTSLIYKFTTSVRDEAWVRHRQTTKPGPAKTGFR
jgi:hypothetical protein